MIDDKNSYVEEEIYKFTANVDTGQQASILLYPSLLGFFYFIPAN